MFFDTRVHFDDFVKDGSLECVLECAATAGIPGMIAVGGSPEANEVAQRMAEAFPERIQFFQPLERRSRARRRDPLFHTNPLPDASVENPVTARSNLIPIS
jgi:hypothetical protein